MTKIVVQQIEQLKEQILQAGSLVEVAIAKAITALTSYDAACARTVIDLKAEIDCRSTDIEEECLKTLAVTQPAIGDLRLVIAVLKIKSELQRIGELARNIAKRVIYLIDTNANRVGIDFTPMARRAQRMVKDSLDALVRGDSSLAHQVRKDDDELDAMRRCIHEEIRQLIQQDSQQAEPLLKLYAVAKHLERIGDMATNIAADVIYMVDGEIVRHRNEE